MLLDRLSYRSISAPACRSCIALHNAEEAVTASAFLPRVAEYVARVPVLREAGLPPSLAAIVHCRSS